MDHKKHARSEFKSPDACPILYRTTRQYPSILLLQYLSTVFALFEHQDILLMMEVLHTELEKADVHPGKSMTQVLKEALMCSDIQVNILLNVYQQSNRKVISMLDYIILNQSSISCASTLVCAFNYTSTRPTLTEPFNIKRIKNV